MLEYTYDNHDVEEKEWVVSKLYELENKEETPKTIIDGMFIDAPYGEKLDWDFD